MKVLGIVNIVLGIISGVAFIVLFFLYVIIDMHIEGFGTYLFICGGEIAISLISGFALLRDAEKLESLQSDVSRLKSKLHINDSSYIVPKAADGVFVPKNLRDINIEKTEEVVRDPNKKYCKNCGKEIKTDYCYYCNTEN